MKKKKVIIIKNNYKRKWTRANLQKLKKKKTKDEILKDIFKTESNLN